MGEPGLSLDFASEAALTAAAGEVARRWRTLAPKTLVVGLDGELGAGKTTLVRAMLRGLGYRARVPSPTYTLLEHYRVGDLTVVHLDLYRLGDTEEFEFLGVRDWLAEPGTWLLVEWPARAPRLADRADLMVSIEIGAGEARRVIAAPHTSTGWRAVASISDLDSNNSA